jgi:hypothetical protein
VRVGPDDGAVEQDPPDLAQLRLGGEQLDQPAEAPRVDPPAERVIHRVERPELSQQIPPRDPIRAQHRMASKHKRSGVLGF